MPENITQTQPTCPKCGATMETQTQQQRSLVDVVGASVLGLLVLGLALLFSNIFGSGGGRYTFTLFIGVPAFIIWVLWHMVGSDKKLSFRCPTCGPLKEQ